ncbi:MAG: hypothetical protein PHN82_09070 [bacterium]|nr:hypothetical protein [bacterium]
MNGSLRRWMAAAVVAAAVACGASVARAQNWQLIYSEDWSGGAGGWSSGQSYLHGKRTPGRIFVGHELAQHAIWFHGQCGWALRSGAGVERPMKIVFRVLMQGSHRNALSMNVRNRGGTLLYKYSMGPRNRVAANCQPAGHEDQPVDTGLVYQLNVPYELTSTYVPGSGYYLSLRNLLTGQEQADPRRWRLKGGGAPSTMDFDQEGGFGPAAVGRVDVYVLAQ